VCEKEDRYIDVRRILKVKREKNGGGKSNYSERDREFTFIHEILYLDNLTKIGSHKKRNNVGYFL